jgi:hypothetical protein
VPIGEDALANSKSQPDLANFQSLSLSLSKRRNPNQNQSSAVSLRPTDDGANETNDASRSSLGDALDVAAPLDLGESPPDLGPSGGNSPGSGSGPGPDLYIGSTRSRDVDRQFIEDGLRLAQHASEDDPLDLRAFDAVEAEATKRRRARAKARVQGGSSDNDDDIDAEAEGSIGIGAVAPTAFSITVSSHSSCSSSPRRVVSDADKLARRDKADELADGPAPALVVKTSDFEPELAAGTTSRKEPLRVAGRKEPDRMGLGLSAEDEEDIERELRAMLADGDGGRGPAGSAEDLLERGRGRRHGRGAMLALALSHQSRPALGMTSSSVEARSQSMLALTNRLRVQRQAGDNDDDGDKLPPLSLSLGTGQGSGSEFHIGRIRTLIREKRAPVSSVTVALPVIHVHPLADVDRRAWGAGNGGEPTETKGRKSSRSPHRKKGKKHRKQNIKPPALSDVPMDDNLP